MTHPNFELMNKNKARAKIFGLVMIRRLGGAACAWYGTPQLSREYSNWSRIYIYTHIHIYIDICKYIYVHIYIYRCMYADVNIYIYVNMKIYKATRIHAFIHVYVCTSE